MSTTSNAGLKSLVSVVEVISWLVCPQVSQNSSTPYSLLSLVNQVRRTSNLHVEAGDFALRGSARLSGNVVNVRYHCFMHVLQVLVRSEKGVPEVPELQSHSIGWASVLANLKHGQLTLATPDSHSRPQGHSSTWRPGLVLLKPPAEIEMSFHNSETQLFFVALSIL